MWRHSELVTPGTGPSHCHTSSNTSSQRIFKYFPASSCAEGSYTRRREAGVWVETLMQVLLGAFQPPFMPKGLFHYVLGLRHDCYENSMKQALCLFYGEEREAQEREMTYP